MRTPVSCVTGLTCVVCGRETAAPAHAGTCPHCADAFATLDVQYDIQRVRRSMTPEALAARGSTLWRYAELLPLGDAMRFSEWAVGWTPLVDAPRLASWCGVEGLRLKDDSRNPTASFKDRASSVGVAHAIEGGFHHAACASTGNAASSLAGFCAVAGIDATIFVPRSAPRAKLTQMLMYGADVRRVQGTYAQAYDLCTSECSEHGWYNRNCAVNPYLVEGKKTCGLEIAEQAGGREPDWVCVSVGDGCTIAGIARGLRQMHELGLLARVPRVLGVQAEGVAPIAEAIERGTEVRPGGNQGRTIADSIDVPVPRNWRKAVREIRETDGACVTVSDDEIGQAMRQAAALAGVYAEPAAAASAAGLRRAVETGVIARGADAICVITGSGLKDVDGAARVAGDARDVQPMAQ